MPARAQRRTAYAARRYSLSRYSPGTSSSGTSCVRTSLPSASPASSTPITTSASNAFPSSSNSLTLSESTLSTLDNPCRSPDCPLERDTDLSNGDGTVSTLWLLLRTGFLNAATAFPPLVRVLTAFAFTAAPSRAAFFFAIFFFTNFFLTFCFIGVTLLPALLNAFAFLFLVLFLAAMRAVYHPVISDASAEGMFRVDSPALTAILADANVSSAMAMSPRPRPGDQRRRHRNTCRRWLRPVKIGGVLISSYLDSRRACFSAVMKSVLFFRLISIEASRL